MTHKIAVIGLPFDLWRVIAKGHAHTMEEMEAGKLALGIIAQQVATQSFHANCGTPAFTTRPSITYKDHFELVVTCDCGEELTVVDGLSQGVLDPVGEQGAFIPNSKQDHN